MPEPMGSGAGWQQKPEGTFLPGAGRKAANGLRLRAQDSINFPPGMLKKTLRLDRKALEAFFKKKTGYAAGNLIHIRYIKNSLNHNRFAVVISFAAGQPQKGRAVLRNLAKRRVLEVIHSVSEEIGSGLDMVFFAKIKGKQARLPIGGQAPKFIELKKDILYVLHRSHILRSIL